MSDPILKKVLKEQSQSHETRIPLYNELEQLIGKPVVSYFTSFRYPVMINDEDADMLENILQTMELDNGFALVISSPGGDGLAAERIIRTCRSYSKTGDYIVLIPGKAKSAATMVCFGASEIYMGKTSELGPVDPQITIREGETVKRYSVYDLKKVLKSCSKKR